MDVFVLYISLKTTGLQLRSYILLYCRRSLITTTDCQSQQQSQYRLYTVGWIIRIGIQTDRQADRERGEYPSTPAHKQRERERERDAYRKN